MKCISKCTNTNSHSWNSNEDAIQFFMNEHVCLNDRPSGNNNGPRNSITSNQFIDPQSESFITWLQWIIPS